MTLRFELIAAEMHAALWRNNSGAAADRAGRLVRYGLGNVSGSLNRVWKSSDFIGIGYNGRFAAVEQKPPGWKYSGNEHERAQLAFINMVLSLGGVAGFASSADDVRRIIEKSR